MTIPEQAITIHVRPLADPLGRDYWRRVAGWLKRGRRDYALCCTSAEPGGVAEQQHEVRNAVAQFGSPHEWSSTP